MFSSEISLATIIIAIAGGISVFALLFSRVLVFFANRKEKESNNSSTGYECGFDADLTKNFRYQTEKIHFVSIYLIFELTVFWLLLCCSFDTMTKDWSGKLFIKVFLIAVVAIILICYKFLFDNNAQK